MGKVVAGNWKMHLGPLEGTRFVEELDLAGRPAETEVILFPPAISVGAVLEALRSKGDGLTWVGVQNVHHEDAGAFTGETSAPMAREAGATHVLVGHSERRHVFGETDEDTRRKVETVLAHELVPVLCLGETLEERREGRVGEVIRRQLDAVTEAEPVRGALAAGAAFLLAYEPVWAIGTGETATPGDASEAHGILRARLEETLGEGSARAIRILYGGSVKPENALQLMEAPGVDGVLVGGASLDAPSFARIVAASG
jgi:triosephosphate isomerase (TIM)